MPVAQALQGAICFGVLLVLPGLGVSFLWDTWRARRAAVAAGRDGDVSFRLAQGVGLSLVVTVLVGCTLIATHTFTATRLALVVTVVALTGLVPAGRLMWQSRRSWWLALSLVFMSVPFVWPAFRPGYAPINNFNWYYWLLGIDLSRVHGIPTWVSEYGRHVRWQPDYLGFNILTEGFRGLLVGASPVDALSVWKVPTTLFAVLVCYAALRIWFARSSAFVGTALLLTTTVFSAKLSNGRPEILGFALGLVAVIIGVRAARRLQPANYLLASVVLAFDSCVHGIGALVAGVILAIATVYEIARARTLWATRARMVAGGCVGFVAVVIATGWSLQGRAFVGTDAGKPRAVSGSDPTLTFFKLTEGLQRRPDPGPRLLGQLLRVTEAENLSRTAGLFLAALLVVSLVTALTLGPRRTREAAIVTIGLAAVLAMGIAWFALRYSTFVPQNTGLSRLAQWYPLVYVMALTSGLDAAARRLSRRWRSGSRRSGQEHPVVPQPVIACVVLALSAAWSVVIAHELPLRLPLAPEAAAAIKQVRASASPGDVLLTNMTTHGLMEFTTDTEVPVEGRQPVIEDPAVLENANTYLQRVSSYYSHPEHTDPRRLLGAQWMLVTDEPASFGATRTYGTPRRSLPRTRGVVSVWHSDHTSLYRVSPRRAAARSVGPPRADIVRWTTAVLVGALVLSGVVWLGRRRSHNQARHVRSRPGPQRSTR